MAGALPALAGVRCCSTGLVGAQCLSQGLVGVCACVCLSVALWVHVRVCPTPAPAGGAPEKPDQINAPGVLAQGKIAMVA